MFVMSVLFPMTANATYRLKLLYVQSRVFEIVPARIPSDSNAGMSTTNGSQHNKTHLIALF